MHNCYYKQIMWKTYRHTGSEEDYAIYKEALNQATNSKRSYGQNIAFNINHDSKSKQKVQNKVDPLEGSDGNIITE